MGEFADLLLAGARARDALEWLLAEARWWAETRKPTMEHFVEFGEPPWLPADDGEQAHD